MIAQQTKPRMWPVPHPERGSGAAARPFTILPPGLAENAKALFSVNELFRTALGAQHADTPAGVRHAVGCVRELARRDDERVLPMLEQLADPILPIDVVEAAFAELEKKLGRNGVTHLLPAVEGKRRQARRPKDIGSTIERLRANGDYDGLLFFALDLNLPGYQREAAALAIVTAARDGNARAIRAEKIMRTSS